MPWPMSCMRQQNQGNKRAVFYPGKGHVSGTEYLEKGQIPWWSETVSKSVADKTLSSAEVDSLFVPLSGYNLLVPMAAVAEVVHQIDCQPDDQPPLWRQGWINWRTQRIPLLSFESLIGDERAMLGDRAMALVLYRILPDGLSKFYALQIQNFPHLIRSADDGLLQQVSLPELPPHVLMMVAVREQQALIPDLNKIEQLLAEVL